VRKHVKQFWLQKGEPISVNKLTGRNVNQKIENKVGEVGRDSR
jgi:hypothetical protein